MRSRFLNDMLTAIAERSRSLVGMEGSSRAPTQPPIELAEALLSERGEASGVAIARDLLAAFAVLDASGKSRFFQQLIEEFGPVSGLRFDFKRIAARARVMTPSIVRPITRAEGRAADARDPKYSRAELDRWWPGSQ